MESTKVECGKYTVVLREDGIIHLVWNPHARIEAADARAALAAVLDLAAGNEYPLLVDMTLTASLSRQAQAVFNTRCAPRIALLGTSPVDRILANWVLSAQNSRARNASSTPLTRPRSGCCWRTLLLWTSTSTASWAA